MALRAFQFNPSIGGFGGESSTSPKTSSRTVTRNDPLFISALSLKPSLHESTKCYGADTSRNCDAFAQIVKELVDNAVDACGSLNDEDAVELKKNLKMHKEIAQSNECDSANVSLGDSNYKRVRVKIESENYQLNKNSNETMDCLRITVSDNGCGMENIDDCVAVFSTSKIGSKTNPCTDVVAQVSEDYLATSIKNKTNSLYPSQKKEVDKTLNRKSSSLLNNSTTISSDGFTSGRYGLGLTLCLLHSQRLVPRSVTCITSATATSREWVRGTYEVDTEANEIICIKKEQLKKEEQGDCGTIISLLVPGGREAQNAWPRLAEYFARFQLSYGLPCSLEVLAPTFSIRPLLIRPPSEMEQRGKYSMSSSIDFTANEKTKNNACSEVGVCNHEWYGDDGFEEYLNHTAHDEAMTILKANKKPSRISRSTIKRQHVELERSKKISFICKGAQAYKGRMVSIENVAFHTQPIRSHDFAKSFCCENGPVLEVSIIVFGPEQQGMTLDEDYHGEKCPNAHHSLYSNDSSAKLQIVRMVNGVPILDSPEALACGIVQKISNSSNWNSFGLDVDLKKKSEAHLDNFGSNDNLILDLKDSAQVAPFFRNSSHDLFHALNEESKRLDSDNADSDSYYFKRKRKNKRIYDPFLPAALRLGDVLMVVHIRAKHSNFHLPSLSKGRLPLNDKGINDALEIGITTCLRSLQRTKPNLLLTAHQLKRFERDSKYVPSVATAIASVLCRSRHRRLYEHTLKVVSAWGDGVNTANVVCLKPVSGQSYREKKIQMNEYERELYRIESLSQILERRLKCIVSEEFKDAEKRRKKCEKEDFIVKQAKKERRITTESNGSQNFIVKSDCISDDCFESNDFMQCVEDTGDVTSYSHSEETCFSSPGMVISCSSLQDDKATDTFKSPFEGDLSVVLDCSDKVSALDFSATDSIDDFDSDDGCIDDID